MIISFFEEYPNKKNLEKIKLLTFQTKLYIAASNLKKFKEIKGKIHSKKVKEVIWWPILKEDEGYWLSPFAKRKALLRIMEESKGISIMWDAERPRQWKLILTQLPNFLKNKKIIRQYISSHIKPVYTAEYFPEKGLAARLLKFLGLEFDPNKYNNKVIKMVYTSMHNYSLRFLRKEFSKGVSLYKDKFLVALGTIATGVESNEPKLSPEQLERDLKLAKEAGVKEVVIYRLGGLDMKYTRAITKFRCEP
ncbi:MAG: hypothetical protein ABIB71_01635 [Candidatus Woesearchaeota archaeon]